MTRLSVNINKVATLRNARGGNLPDLSLFAMDCERFGADGITIHPRPDERHITTNDVYALKELVTTELNIEGYPNKRFLKLIEEIRPQQVTLVPDEPNVITSNNGWDTKKHKEFLKDITKELHSYGCRVSLFMNPSKSMIEICTTINTDRIELYTGPYAASFEDNKNKAIKDYVESALFAKDIGLGINAGHDLNLSNLYFFKKNIPWLDEVSIGHALISDALYYGIENTIRMYQTKLNLG